MTPLLIPSVQVDAHPAFTQPLAIPHAQNSLSDFSQLLALFTTISPKDAAPSPLEAASTSSHETEQDFDLTEILAFQIVQTLPSPPVITPPDLILTPASTPLLAHQNDLQSAPVYFEDALSTPVEPTKSTTQPAPLNSTVLNIVTPVAHQQTIQSRESLIEPTINPPPEPAKHIASRNISSTVSASGFHGDVQDPASQKPTLNDASLTPTVITTSALTVLAAATQTTAPPIPTAPLPHQPTTLPSVQLATASLLSAKITRAVSNGTSTFTIRLDPPEFGRLDVRLEMNDTGNIIARIAVEKPETLDFLFRDQRGFERSLTQAGFNADQTQLEFSLSMQDFSRNTPHEPNQHLTPPQSQTDALTIEAPPSNAPLQMQYASTNTSSHLDIHV